jgi:hypothetical protein
LIIASNGVTKNTRKNQQADIAKAQNLRSRYLAAKSQPSTKIQLILLSHEN